MKYLLDTNICIAAMRHKLPVVHKLSTLSPAEVGVSVITNYELHAGVEKCKDPIKERAKVELLLATVTQLMFDGTAALEAARLRALLEAKGQMIGPYDILLAGQAVANKLIFVTDNTSEFSRVPHLSLENWLATP